MAVNTIPNVNANDGKLNTDDGKKLINKESSLIIIKNVNKNKRNKFIEKYFCCFNKIKPI